MPVKSVLEVEVRAAAFDKFMEMFSKYQKMQEGMPGTWKAVGKETAAVGKSFDAMSSALTRHYQVSQQQARLDQQQVVQTGKIASFWESMSQSSSVLFRNVINIGASLLKWGGLLGGIAAGGSLFGIDKMAAGVADQRRSAAGLGVSIGQQRAFDINFGRFVDANALLSGTNAAVTDIAQQGNLYALGVNPNGSTADVALAVLQAVRAKVMATPEKLLGRLEEQYNLDQRGFKVEDLRRIKGASAEEWNQQTSLFRRDAATLNINDQTARRWQDFTSRMEAAGAQISKVFVNGLVPLAGPLKELSGATVHLLQKVMSKDGIVSQGIEKLSGWITDLSKGIGGSDFQKSFATFLDDAGILAKGIHAIAEVIKPFLFMLGGAAATGGEAIGLADAMARRSSFLGNPDKQRYLDILSKTESQFKLPAGLLAAQWAAESNSSLDPVVSSKGAVGAFQFMDDTAKALGIDSKDPLQSQYGAGVLDQQLMRRYKGNIALALAAYNWKPDRVDALYRAHPNDWQSVPFRQGGLPAETRAYLQKIHGMLASQGTGVRISVENQTGGSATVAVHQLSGF